MPSAADDDSITVQPRKRKRAAFACEACRIRKRRCDGDMPACQGCTRRRATCVYSSEIEAREWQASAIDTLRARLSELEKAQAVTEPAQVDLCYTVPEPPAPPSQPLPGEAGHQVDEDDRAGIRHVFDHAKSPALSAEPTHSVDLPIAPRVESQPYRLERLMRPIEQALERRASSSSPKQQGPLGASRDWSAVFDAPTLHAQPSTCTCHVALDAGQWNLPMRRRADELLAYYFAKPHRVFPVLHQRTFQRQYERLWTAGSGGLMIAQQNVACVKLCKQKTHGRLFPATLNMCFALGSLHDKGTPAQNVEQADYFFRLTKGVDLMDVLHTQMQIEPIQLGILISTYLQATDRFTECWNMAGLTIRTAQSIGLDLSRDEAPGGGLVDSCTTQVDWELRKRLWGACVILKGEISSSFGRPITIGSSMQMQLPVSIDDDQLSDVVGQWNSQPEGVPSWIDGVIQRLKLMRILEPNIDEDRRVTRGQLETSPDYRVILQQDTKLMQWNAALPLHLQPASAIEGGVQDRTATTQHKDDWSLLSAIKLQSWYLHVRQLALRPALEYLFVKQYRQITQPTLVTLETSIQELALSKIALQCVVLAQNLVKLLETESNVLIAWWINIDYLYTCGSTILMARCCSLKDDHISEQSLTSTWQCCLERLARYSAVSSVAQKSLRLLRSSAGQLFGAGERQDVSQQDRDLIANDVEPSTLGPDQQGHLAMAATGFRAAGMARESIAQDDLVPATGNMPMDVDMGFTSFDAFDDVLWDPHIAVNIPYWPSLSEFEQLPANLRMTT